MTTKPKPGDEDQAGKEGRAHDGQDRQGKGGRGHKDQGSQGDQEQEDEGREALIPFHHWKP
jgi:hypothetical protein